MNPFFTDYFSGSLRLMTSFWRVLGLRCVPHLPQASCSNINLTAPCCCRSSKFIPPLPAKTNAQNTSLSHSGILAALEIVRVLSRVCYTTTNTTISTLRRRTLPWSLHKSIRYILESVYFGISLTKITCQNGGQIKYLMIG
jgi:hypothetical protein